MAPESDGEKDKSYTVGCSLRKLIPDITHLTAIQDGVTRTHRAVLFATELLNLHVRRLLDENSEADLQNLFDANWIVKALNTVTTSGSDRAQLDPALVTTRDTLMPKFDPPSRKGLAQVFGHEARNLKAVAENNVWMHFRRRISSYVNVAFTLPKEEYKALTKDERRARRLALMQVVDDLMSHPDTQLRSPEDKHAWIVSERDRLGINRAVGEWHDKPLLYHIKARPWRFVYCMRLMSTIHEQNGKRAMALYPMRRSMVPRHIRLDQTALRELLQLGVSEARKEAARKKYKEMRGASAESEEGSRKRKRNRQTSDALRAEKGQLFNQVVDLKTAGVSQPQRFEFSFTTDGVCARLLYARPVSTTSIKKKAKSTTMMPRRGMYCIDELKRMCRQKDSSKLHVIGIDPGMRELICAVDCDSFEDPKAHTERYTLRQRMRDRRSVDAATEIALTKPGGVGLAEQMLSEHNSRSSSTSGFQAYVHTRHERLEECLSYYGEMWHRRRRWKTYIKTQKSEERLYTRLKSMHSNEDDRQLVLAYGAWGAKDASSCIKKGTAPAIGKGLLNKLRKRFLCAITPEFGTSSMCIKCFSKAGRWTEKEEKWKKPVRGLRVCQNESCGCALNRDRSAAKLIGLNFKRLIAGQTMVCQMCDEEREFLRLNLEDHSATVD